MSKKQLILLVDDDAHISRGIGDYLTTHGFEVSLAKTAEEALGKLKSLNPDLIILDIMMPGIGGLGFLREIGRNENGDPIHPVIVLSARAGMSDFFDDSQVSAFLPKPCSGSDLLAEVQRVLDDNRREEPTAPRAREKMRILIGESDRSYADKLKKILRARGCDITVGSSGVEVIDAAAIVRPHLVLLNDTLEGMNGRAVAALLADMPSTKDASLLLYDFSITLLRRQSGGKPLPVGVDKWMSPVTVEQVAAYAQDSVPA